MLPIFPSSTTVPPAFATPQSGFVRFWEKHIVAHFTDLVNCAISPSEQIPGAHVLSKVCRCIAETTFEFRFPGPGIIF